MAPALMSGVSELVPEVHAQQPSSQHAVPGIFSAPWGNGSADTGGNERRKTTRSTELRAPAGASERKAVKALKFLKWVKERGAFRALFALSLSHSMCACRPASSLKGHDMRHRIRRLNLHSPLSRSIRTYLLLPTPSSFM